MTRRKSPSDQEIGPHELRVLLKIIKGTTTILDLDALYKFVTQAILEELGRYHHASIWLPDQTGKFLIPEVISESKSNPVKPTPRNYRQEIQSGILGRVFRSGKSYTTNDTAKDPYFVGADFSQSRSELCVPIREGKAILGLLNVESIQTNAITKTDLVAFQILTDHIANAMKNARIYSDLKQINDRLMEFQQLACDISGTLHLQKILEITIQRLPEIMGTELCSIFLRNPVTGVLELKAHNHDDLSDKKSSIKKTEMQVIKRIVGLSKSQWIHNIETEFSRRNRRKYTTKSSLNLLLKAGDEMVGIVNLNNKHDGENFSEHDFNLADFFASHLALSINNCFLYERTLQMALFDGLTGLYVHRHFQEVLDREVARSARTHAPFSLMLADIDHFKTINDTFGHQSGDVVLRALSNSFNRLVRQVDFVARYGGEEFAFILPDTSKEKAKVLATRIRRSVKQTRFKIGEKSCRVTLSFGIAETDGSVAKDELIRLADQALYAAKRAGRDRTVVDDS